MAKTRSVGIFCGSNFGKNSIYRQTAVKFSRALTVAGMTVVYGGASVGLMKVIADTTLESGGRVIGVIPQALVDLEIAHSGLTELHIVNSMHERKALIAQLSQAFVMLPGGTGSLDEFFEIYTWCQLGFHHKPCGILNINQYFNHLIQFLDHAVGEGFLKKEHRETIMIDDSPQRLLQKLENFQPYMVSKWLQEA